MKKTKTGSCIYCGQVGTVEVVGNPTEEELDRMVTEKCTCKEAKAAAERIKVQTTAENNIDRLFGKEFPAITDMLKMAAVLVYSRKINKCSVEISGISKASIQLTSDNNIKVERTDTRKTSLEH